MDRLPSLGLAGEMQVYGHRTEFQGSRNAARKITPAVIGFARRFADD